MTLQGAPLAVGANGEKAETEQTTRVCLKTFFQIPGTVIFPGFLENLSAKISVGDGKTEGEHTNGVEAQILHFRSPSEM